MSTHLQQVLNYNWQGSKTHSTAVSQLFLSESKASDKDHTSSLCQSVKYHGLLNTFSSPRGKEMWKSHAWRTSHLRVLWVCWCFHVAFHIWRKLKQMKTNTSFLHVNTGDEGLLWCFRAAPPTLPKKKNKKLQPFLRSLSLNKIQTDEQWRCILYYSSYINQQQAFLDRWLFSTVL